MLVAADDADDAPDIPEELEYLWDWFMELHAVRTGNGFGPNPISYLELAAWSRLCDIAPQPWEVRAIRAVDDAYIAASRSRTAEASA